MKSIIDGLLGVLWISWELLKDIWRTRSDAQKSALIGVALLLIMAFGFMQCPRAEPATLDTNYGIVNMPNGTALICHMQDGVPETGVVTLCLLAQPVAPGLFAVGGQAVFCAVTGLKENQPFWDCGDYEAVQAKIQGV